MRAATVREHTETIHAVATVMLDAAALEQLGPATMDRLADLVESRIAQRRAAGEEPLLTIAQAAEIAGVHPETLRKAIRSGALTPTGYVGQRPRLRRAALEEWVATGQSAQPSAPSTGRRLAVVPRTRTERVLGDSLRAHGLDDRRAG